MHRGNEHESVIMHHARHDNFTLWTLLYLITQYSCISRYSYFCLYIHAGSPNIISLNFDNQSRTLTCASTGGPATTVTWRRDGVVITLNDTHHQTKILVDAVNGTYQTVLTINFSVDWNDIVGTYNCTVHNDRGESSETVVVPGETCSLGTLHTVHTNYIFFLTFQLKLDVHCFLMQGEEYYLLLLDKQAHSKRSIVECIHIRGSVDSLFRDGADAQYMQYLTQSNLTWPQNL